MTLEMKLLAFPFGRELVQPFLDKIGAGPFMALILEKQQPLVELLTARGISEIHLLPESFYGKVTSRLTRERLSRILEKKPEAALFPMSDFCGNVAPLL